MEAASEPQPRASSPALPAGRASYISLRSYKRNGEPVDTPVWWAALDGRIVLFTLRETYKVKRIARDPRVQVAECTVGGKLLGPFLPGRCRIVEDPAEQARAYAALRRKYWFGMRAGDVLSTLSGRIRRRVVLEVTLVSEQSG